MMDKVKNVIKFIIELGLYLVAVAILVQVLFGQVAPFFGALNVIGAITGIIKSLGENGLVGLLALLVIAWLFNKSSISK